MNPNHNPDSKRRLLIGKLSRFLALIVLSWSVSAFQCGFFGGRNSSSGGDKDWRVWIRTDPCPGRFDWLTIAKENPGGTGLGTYWLYTTYITKLLPDVMKENRSAARLPKRRL